MNTLVQIQELLKEKADCQARLKLMPYDGSPEIKELGEKIFICPEKSCWKVNFNVCKRIF